MISDNLSNILLYMRVSWFRSEVSFAGLSICRPDWNCYGFIYSPNIIRERSLADYFVCQIIWKLKRKIIKKYTWTPMFSGLFIALTKGCCTIEMFVSHQYSHWRFLWKMEQYITHQYLLRRLLWKLRLHLIINSHKIKFYLIPI